MKRQKRIALVACLLCGIASQADAQTNVRELSGQIGNPAVRGEGPPRIFGFAAVPSVITPGQSSTLGWAVSDQVTISIVPSVGAVDRGSITVSPAHTTKYTLFATNFHGTSTATATLTVTTDPASVPPVPPRVVPAVPTIPNPPRAPDQTSVSADDFHPAGYSLVFADEFEGSNLDRGKWCTRYTFGGGAGMQVPDSVCAGPTGQAGTLDFLNDEQQRYVDVNAGGEVMHRVGNGTLTLRATKTRADGYASYEAAMIRSKQEFRPDALTSFYLVTRVRLPNVRGTWPAFWLASGFGTNGRPEWPPEIDIFEGALNGVDDRANMLRMGAHTGARQTDSGKQEITFSDPRYELTWNNYRPETSLRDTWLVIGAEWTASSVCYYVDRVETMCENYRWVFDDGSMANGANVLLNLAIGGGWAGRYGIDDALFPTGFEIDYLRVYRN
jgi:hypothetical protein